MRGSLNILYKENKMADIITGTTTGYVNNIPDNTFNAVSDVRREAAEHTNEIVKEGLKSNYDTLGAIKDSRYETVSRVENNADRLERSISATHSDTLDRFFSVSRDTSDLRAQVTALGYQVRDGHAALAKDMEINALKSQLEAQKNTQFLADRIGDEGEKTRARINDINDRDNQRHLIERNTELVAALDDGRFWRGRYDDSQWQSLNSRLQAFQSDLADTRQGMVNFGTMAGVGQSSTTNQVR